MKLENSIQDTITTNNFEENKRKLSDLIRDGKYDEALPLADLIFNFRVENGHKESALIQYASNYYSAANRLWKENSITSLPKVVLYMNKALRALEERIDIEVNKRKEVDPSKNKFVFVLGILTPSELDVIQAIYSRASEISSKISGIQKIREHVPKEWDFIRDFDAAALLAIRTGLKKIDLEDSKEDNKKPHTRIFLLCGAFEVFKRYKKDDLASQFADKIFFVAEKYPWPEIIEKSGDEIDSQRKSLYGQTTRVARHLRDVARVVGNTEKEQEFKKKVKNYSDFVLDQKAKL